MQSEIAISMYLTWVLTNEKLSRSMTAMSETQEEN